MTNNSKSYVGGGGGGMGEGGKKGSSKFFCFSNMLANRPKTIAVINYVLV